MSFAQKLANFKKDEWKFGFKTCRDVTKRRDKKQSHQRVSYFLHVKTSCLEVSKRSHRIDTHRWVWNSDQVILYHSCGLHIAIMLHDVTDNRFQVDSKPVCFLGVKSWTITAAACFSECRTEGWRQLIKFTGTKANLSSLSCLVLVIASLQEPGSSQIKADASPASSQAACGAAADEVAAARCGDKRLKSKGRKK